MPGVCSASNLQVVYVQASASQGGCAPLIFPPTRVPRYSDCWRTQGIDIQIHSVLQGSIDSIDRRT